MGQPAHQRGDCCESWAGRDHYDHEGTAGKEEESLFTNPPLVAFFLSSLRTPAFLREPIRIDAPALATAHRLPAFLSSVSSVSWFVLPGLPARLNGQEDCARRRRVAEVGDDIDCRFLGASALLREPIGIDAA